MCCYVETDSKRVKKKRKKNLTKCVEICKALFVWMLGM